ncbi:MAG: MBL fold metallo-hydrolase [Hyphomicrobiales bacterium]
MALAFNTDFNSEAGEAVDLGNNIRRITAPNSGPYTFRGTNTYLVGSRSIAIVDPGPDDDSHLDALLLAIEDRPVEAIVLTHSHLDHTPLTGRLKALTGAPVFAQGRHRPYRELSKQEMAQLGRSADLAFEPDKTLHNGAVVEGTDWQLETVLTPGHTANHAAFSVVGTDIMISGDHVMGWSTTIVAPPDGSMADYIRSLDVLLKRPEATYLPGHGDLITSAHAYVKGLKTHRIMREAAILEQLEQGHSDISEIVKVLYKTTPEKLHGAAAMTVLAHIEALIEAGRVSCSDILPGLKSTYRTI